MTTKRAKKVVVYLASLLVIFTLITTCLLGNTFAKYATGTIGDAKSEISYWNVDNGGSLNSSTATTFSETNGLSPKASGVSPTLTKKYYNTTKVNQIATVTISSDTEVNVRVHLAATALDFYDSSSESISSWGSGIVSYGTPTEAEVRAALTLHVMWAASTSQTAPTVTLNSYGTYSSGLGNNSGTDYGEITISNSTSTSTYERAGATWTAKGTTTYYYIYCWVTWTTDYTASGYSSTDNNGVYYADLLDTWIAENVSYVQTTISVMTIQASTSDSDLPS